LSQANPRDPNNFPFVVIGNKVDKEAERRVPKSKATQWCKSKAEKPISHFETSAKEAIKVESAFLEAAQMALQQEVPDSQAFIPETIQLSNKKEEKKSSGCC
jgi:Ras-related protein Rab-7A